MQVHDRRVLIPPGFVRQRDRSLADVQRLHDIGVRGRGAGLQVPQTSHGPHHQGLGEQGHDVVVQWEIAEHAPHLGRIIVVPTLERRDGDTVRLLKAAAQRLDQADLDGGAV